MARQKKSIIKSVITWLLLLLFLAGGIGVICHFVGIDKDDITDIVNPTFRVVSGESVFKADKENVFYLPASGQARFEIKGTKGYTAKVIPNVTAETDFEYTVDGISYPYSGETDLSYAFDLKCYDNVLTINTDSDYTLESMLSKLWGIDKEFVTVNEHENFSFYKLLVTSLNGENVEILLNIQVTDITVYPDKIIFGR